MTNILTVLETQYSRLQTHPSYQKIMSMPSTQRWLTILGLFIISQLIVFGFLYLIFDKIVVIGFFASILAGLATGLGALPVVFLKDIPERLFNSLLGAAAGVMLAATAFSLLVPGIDHGNLLWPGKGLWVVSAGMLIGALFLHFADQRLPHFTF